MATMIHFRLHDMDPVALLQPLAGVGKDGISSTGQKHHIFGLPGKTAQNGIESRGSIVQKDLQQAVRKSDGKTHQDVTIVE